jgi:bifunctional UDP-N-acetylglucosamine pyrophosphorylase/glucosamine-1-phosphate N-acetyltransferase
MPVKAVVLAAGEGTRMKSQFPKVLHRVAGRTMLDWVLDAVGLLESDRTVVVIGHHAEDVQKTLPDGVDWCVQTEQLGTGHAMQVALDELGDVSADTVVVVPGDTPLLGERLRDLVARHHATGAAATFLTARLPDPHGYGRIVRDDQGDVVGVVEHADADSEQLSIAEVNGGVYAFDGARLQTAVARLDRDNALGEYYLPDVVAVLAGEGDRLEAVEAGPEEVMGVNSHDQLAEADAVARHRINREWMRQGVWMQDPTRVYIDAGVRLAPGVHLHPGVHLAGETSVAEGAVLGPDVYAVDSRIGAGARIWYAVLREAVVGDEVEVGPYASLRPGSVLEQSAKAGTFVELKNTHLGKGAKVPHLSYMGDADIGPRANIGAGSITCNYDGVSKHRTIIGAGAFIGSDTMLVAPVEIGPDAVTGAGSTITHNVSPGALAIERSSQEEIPGYAERVETRRRNQQE